MKRAALGSGPLPSEPRRVAALGAATPDRPGIPFPLSEDVRLDGARSRYFGGASDVNTAALNTAAS